MKPNLKTEHDLEYSKTSKELTSSLSKKEKKDNGIYFTPPSCVRKNIELLRKYLPGEIKEGFTILEPSCGSGEYIKALCEDDTFTMSTITGVEINKTIFEAVKKLHDTNMNIRLFNSDFLKYSCDSTYNLIIGNPPYFVLKKEDVVSDYNKFYDGRPNIFILFVVKCLGMLANGGILSFVLPKSFLNCLYYDKTRKYINDNFIILDIVECSDDKYIETAQETIIIILKKPNALSSSTDVATVIDNTEYTLRILGSNYTIFNTKCNITIFNELYENATTLSALNFKVSVGNVVWNQCKDILTDDKNETLLIYSSDIANNKLEIKTYKSDEKKNYIIKPGVRRPIVVINRGYGTGEYKFNHCLIDGQREYLIENHLICVESLEKTNSEDIINNYRKIMKSFDDKRTSRFIEVYFGNSAINTTELRNVLPIYGYTT
jgi:hypothetical protein